jgi:hypothetical protein
MPWHSYSTNDNVSLLLLFIDSIKFSEEKSEVKCLHCAVELTKVS